MVAGRACLSGSLQGASSTSGVASTGCGKWARSIRLGRCGFFFFLKIMIL